MNQQEAYQVLVENLRQQKILKTEASRLARDHGLVLEVLEDNGTQKTIDPKYMKDSRTFRDDLTEDELNELKNKDDSFDYYDIDEIRGADIHDSWVPSQFC